MRHTRRIEVTPEGERLAAGVRRGLLEFRHAVASINRREGTQIRITGIPSHVTRWLAPACTASGRRTRRSSCISRPTWHLADLRQQTFDVALRFGSGVYPGLHAEHLMDDAIFPVASPRYLVEAGPIDGASRHAVDDAHSRRDR